MSEFTTLSTHGSLKMKSISLPSVCNQLSDGVAATNNTNCMKCDVVNNDDNVLQKDDKCIFPISGSDKNDSY